MEQNNPPVDDVSFNVSSLPPYTNQQRDAQVSNVCKSGPATLLSAIFMIMVGITFTVMGWIRWNQGFGWTQLFGPLLLLAGVTFALVAICRLRILICKCCKRRNETAVDPEQLSTGQSFVFTGINQPITFHGATVVQYIPPPYTPHDAMARSSTASPAAPSNSSDGLVNGIAPPLFPPQYCNIYSLENPAFVEDGEFSQSPDHVRSCVSGRHHEDFLSIQRHSGQPPLYEELFPNRK